MTGEQALFQGFKNRVVMYEKEVEFFEQRRRSQKSQRSDEAAQPSDDDIQVENLRSRSNDWRVINRAVTLLNEVKDIQDELSILRRLIAQQQHVWNDLSGETSGNHDARNPSFTARALENRIGMTDKTLQSVPITFSRTIFLPDRLIVARSRI